MSVFVTGASGFLGSRLAEILVERGEQVLALARPTAKIEHLAHLPIRIVRGDLSDIAILEGAVREVSTIFHCAACSTDWAPLKTYYQANVEGTKNLLAAARGAGNLRRFVHVSTCDVYGYPRIPCDETHSMRDIGLPYNQTKCLGEAAVWQAAEEFGLPITILRPATIYGPRGQAFVVDIAELLRQGWMACIDRGRAPGGFTYVDNVVGAMLAAAESSNSAGQAFNISDGSGATWAEYLTSFAAGLGCRPPWINLPFPVAMSLARVMEAPYKHFKLDGRPLLTRHAVYLLGLDQEFPIAKAKQVFGFRAPVGLEEGIARSVAWLKDSGRSR